MITPPNSVMYGTRSPSHGSSSRRSDSAAAITTRANRYESQAGRKAPDVSSGRAGKFAPQAGALAQQLPLHILDADAARQQLAPGRERAAHARRLARGHDDRHHAIRRMRF